VLATELVPLAALPTATHDPPDGHEMSEMALNDGGGVALAQVEPPSELLRKTGAVAKLPVAPPATQLVDDEQETLKTLADDAGSATDLKVDPPSVVSIASPGKVGSVGPSAFGPTATHVELDGHVIENS
jgi:hypothetical protein